MWGLPRIGFVVVFLMTCFAAASAQEQLADLKPLVGKWRGQFTGERGTVQADLIIQEDGSYTAILYGRPVVTGGGTLQLVDGTVRFKNAQGNTGTFTLYVDAKGKRVLKTVRDDGAVAEYEPLK